MSSEDNRAIITRETDHIVLQEEMVEIVIRRIGEEITMRVGDYHMRAVKRVKFSDVIVTLTSGVDINMDSSKGWRQAEVSHCTASQARRIIAADKEAAQRDE